MAGIQIELKGAEIEDRLSDLEAKQIEFEDLLILGKAFADRLLPERDGIRSSFIKFVDETIAEGKRVRLRLIIRDIGLQLIPWEYIRLKLSDAGRDINHFLCLNPLISLVRNLPLGKELPKLAPKDARKVSVMAVMANPQFPGLPDLDLEAERRVLEGIFDEVSKGDQMIDWQPFNGENHLSKGDVAPVKGTRCSKVLSLLESEVRDRATVSTPLCDLLNIEFPIIQAPMGGVATPALVAAVSNAGGLGVLPLTWHSPEQARRAIRHTLELTDRPFGVNLILQWPQHERLQVCLEEEVPVVSFFWGDPSVNAIIKEGHSLSQK